MENTAFYSHVDKESNSLSVPSFCVWGHLQKRTFGPRARKMIQIQPETNSNTTRYTVSLFNNIEAKYEKLNTLHDSVAWAAISSIKLKRRRLGWEEIACVLKWDSVLGEGDGGGQHVLGHSEGWTGNGGDERGTGRRRRSEGSAGASYETKHRIFPALGRMIVRC